MKKDKEYEFVVERRKGQVILQPRENLRSSEMTDEELKQVDISNTDAWIEFREFSDALFMRAIKHEKRSGVKIRIILEEDI